MATEAVVRKRSAGHKLAGLFQRRPRLQVGALLAGPIGWLVLIAGLTFLVVLGFGWATAGPDPSAVPNQTQVVQVHPGDTLWSVAHRMAPNAAPSAVVDRIRQLNSLDIDVTVYPGELLLVPSDLSGAAAAKAGAIQR